MTRADRIPRLGAVLLTALWVGPALAGCMEEATKEPASPSRRSLPQLVQVTDDQGQGITNAQVTASRGSTPLLVFSTDGNGRFATHDLPASTTHITIGASGFIAVILPVDAVTATVVLQAGPTAPPPTNGATTPASTPPPATGPGLPPPPEAPPLLGFRDPVDLLCPEVDVPGAECGAFGEPVVEVQGDGTVWASATCCIGRSPPIWVSRDEGRTFALLSPVDQPGTELVRQGTGVEGDFAVDDAGNVYFFDILAATSWFTSYAPDGTHRWTLAWPFTPLVDRPWVRAGAADEAYVIYNTGTSTNVYKSVDGGKTWDAQPLLTTGCPLGTPGQGPARERLFVTSCAEGTPALFLSEDGAQTWAEPEEFPIPVGDFPNGRGIDFQMPPVADAAGNIFVAFTHFVDKEGAQSAIFLSRRDANGVWAGPFQISAEGLVAKPWTAAGDAGHFGVAWYQSDGDAESEQRAEWKLMTAASVDAGAAAPHFQVVKADPEILLKGPFERNLGDFLQADITPDGRLVVVYGKQVASVDAPHVQNRFVSSDGFLPLGAGVPRNGPLG